MRCTIYPRDLTLTAPLIVSGIDMFVNRYSWHYQMGAESASVSLRGTQQSLFQACGLLRCPIVITDYRSQAVWWGIVSAVEVRWGSRVLNVSISSLANKVRVQYTKRVQDAPDEAALTDWMTDPWSIGWYGERQKTISGGQITDDQADHLRYYTFHRRRWPRPVLSTGQSEGGSASGLMTCTGWYETISWKYFTMKHQPTEDSGALIHTMVDDAGQFITNVQTITTGVTAIEPSSEWRTTWPRIVSLMEQSTTDGDILCASITQDRVFVLRKEPLTPTPTIYVDDKDRWHRYASGDIIPKQECPVGTWMKITSVPPNAGVLGLYSADDVFIARSIYETAENRLTIEPLGSQNPMESIAQTESE